jgi:hypothetical protein
LEKNYHLMDNIQLHNKFLNFHISFHYN